VFIVKRREARTYLFQIVSRQQSLLLKHLRVRDRGTHVVAHQALIEGVVLTGRVAQHAFIERCALVPKACHAGFFARRRFFMRRPAAPRGSGP